MEKVCILFLQKDIYCKKKKKKKTWAPRFAFCFSVQECSRTLLAMQDFISQHRKHNNSYCSRSNKVQHIKVVHTLLAF